MRHPLTYPSGTIASLLRLMRIKPEDCYIDLGPAEAEVRLGWMFRQRFPATAIVAAERFTGHVQPTTGARVQRLKGGRMTVMTMPQPLVVLKLDPPQRLRVMRIPGTVREIVASVADPDALIADVNAAG
ncbi:MAG TPA: hypothetical protein VF529_16895 [Solirubrobacteraceae bacterium]|jgi:hypothetical protein